MLKDRIRNRISRKLTGEREIAFTNQLPSEAKLSANFAALASIGLYLHIPFCNRICPYCPYNKELFSEEACRAYTSTIKQEIDAYSALLDGKEVSSFYIGGGTPTSMLGIGLEDIIEHAYKRFNMHCGAHMESHPNHLTKENLRTVKSLGTRYLSVGVEALQDHHLKAIERPYTVSEVKTSVGRAMEMDFECVNIDYIFDLPGQTEKEVEEAGKEMVKLGMEQAATYPLFSFPYTRFGQEASAKRAPIPTMFRRRKLLKILEEVFYSNGYERSSVWAFTKSGIDKYCSVTVPSYIGLGASGGSYLNDLFYVNTFKVAEYIQSYCEERSPIALSLELTEEMQMAGWLYWRIYETQFSKSDFVKRFGSSFDKKYGKYMNILKRLGFLVNGEDHVKLTDLGTYWIHAFEDFFSIDYINKLWGRSRYDAWPERIKL